MSAPESRTDVDVVVVGGGIGGLASALALAHTGLKVKVLERAEEFAEVGAGLQMAPNATRILREWGLLERVLHEGVEPARLVFRDAVDGSLLTTVDFDDDFRERFLAPYIVIHRSDLLAILVDACVDAGVELVPGCLVTDVIDIGGSVEVMSSTGTHAAAAALAADGLQSTMRSRVSQDEPIASGYVAYRGTIDLTEVDYEVEPVGLESVVVHMGPRCHLVQYPLRRGEIFNTVAVFQSPGFLRGEAEWGGPEELDAAFADTCPAVQKGLGLLWRDRRWPMFDRTPIDTWVDGRVALIGDAAHPMLQYLAQGACQAIEDAASLADAVGKTEPGDWPAALDLFQVSRRERTAQVQNTARTWGEIWHVDGVSRLMRNEIFRSRAPGDLRRADWLYASRT